MTEETKCQYCGRYVSYLTPNGLCKDCFGEDRKNIAERGDSEVPAKCKLCGVKYSLYDDDNEPTEREIRRLLEDGICPPCDKDACLREFALRNG